MICSDQDLPPYPYIFISASWSTLRSICFYGSTRGPSITTLSAKEARVPVYYTFFLYNKNSIVPKEEWKFTAPTEKRRAEFNKDNENGHKAGA